MAIKRPAIDITSVLAQTLAKLRIPERVGMLPNVASERTRTEFLHGGAHVDGVPGR